MYKIGLSTCCNDGIINRQLFEDYSKAGIDAMEISMPSDYYENINYKQLEKLSSQTGIELWSYHLPFAPFDRIDISNRATYKNTVGYFEELIKKAAQTGIKRFIIHASGEPINDEERRERMKCAREGLEILAETAKKNNAVIAVEDLPRSCLGKNSDEISELIGNNDNLKVCLDTNHLLGENLVEFIHKMGKKIITTHISDYDFVNERHWLPGEGKLNWNDVLNALRDIEYDGVWMYEIGFSCPKTIIRDRRLNCDDFVKNAEEIFEERNITVFSQHKEKLGMWE